MVNKGCLVSTTITDQDADGYGGGADSLLAQQSQAAEWRHTKETRL